MNNIYQKKNPLNGFQWELYHRKEEMGKQIWKENTQGQTSAPKIVITELNKNVYLHEMEQT